MSSLEDKRCSLQLWGLWLSLLNRLAFNHKVATSVPHLPSVQMLSCPQAKHCESDEPSKSAFGTVEGVEKSNPFTISVRGSISLSCDKLWTEYSKCKKSGFNSSVSFCFLGFFSGVILCLIRWLNVSKPARQSDNFIQSWCTRDILISHRELRFDF